MSNTFNINHRSNQGGAKGPNDVFFQFEDFKVTRRQALRGAIFGAVATALITAGVAGLGASQGTDAEKVRDKAVQTCDAQETDIVEDRMESGQSREAAESAGRAARSACMTEELAGDSSSPGRP